MRQSRKRSGWWSRGCSALLASGLLATPASHAQTAIERPKVAEVASLTINDVVPASSDTNVTGIIVDSNG